MKKFLITACVLMTGLCGALGLAACGEEAHVHDWDKWVSDGNGGHFRVCKTDSSHMETGKCEDHFVYKTSAATCTEAGETTYGCVACGYTYTVTEQTPPLNHNYGDWTFDAEKKQHTRVCANDPTHVESVDCDFEETTVAATCETDGYTLHTCKDCGGSYRDNVQEKLTHKWGPWESVEGTGTHVRYCTNDRTHKQDGVCDYRLEETVEATCTENGYELYRCNDCKGEEKRNEKIAPGHNWSSWTFDSERHVHYHTCLNADCEENAREEFPCEGEGVETKPTCEGAGFTTYSCPVCYGVYTTYDEETQKALGHVYPAKYTPAENGSHYRECTRADCDHRELGSCDYDVVSTAADCTQFGTSTYTCRFCEYSYKSETSEKGPHKYGAWENVEGELYHHRLCDVCGDEDREACTYTPVTVNATCTAAGETTYVCNTCRDIDEARTTVIDQLDHDYPLDWTHIDDATGGVSRHYRVCRRPECSHREEADCDMEEVKGLPTCTTPADIFHICSGCHFTEDVGDVAKLEHKWSKWEHIEVFEDGKTVHYHVRRCEREECDAKTDGKAYSERQLCAFEQTTVNSTCLTAGTTTYTCSECRFDYTETTGRALGHDYGNWEPVGGGRHAKTCRRPECDGNNDSPRVIYGTCDFVRGQTVDPTCLTAGYTVWTCNECNRSEHREPQTALGHDFEDSDYYTNHNGTHYRVCSRDPNHRETVNCQYRDSVTDPTCETQGYTTQTCTLCDYSRRVNYQDALGHKWRLYSAMTVATDDHTHVAECERCLTHQTQNCSYNTRVVPATCTVPAKHIHTCTFCEHVYEHDEGSPLGHAWGSYVFDGETRTHDRTCTRSDCAVKEGSAPCQGAVVSVHEANCNSYGWNNYQCSVCKGEYIDDMGSEFGEHKWTPGWERTPTDESTHFKSCVACGEKRVEQCQFTDNSRPATCTAAGFIQKFCPYCTRTVARNERALGHDFGDSINPWQPDLENPGNHYRACTRADCGYREEKPCAMVDLSKAATCDSEGQTGRMCNTCGYAEGVKDLPKLQHQMSAITSAGDGTHFQYCLRMCGYQISDDCVLEGTDQAEATCTAPAGRDLRCAKCNYTIHEITQEALGHDWEIIGQANETTHSARCRRQNCGETVEGEHDFVNSNLCSVCKYDGLTYEFGDSTHSYYVVKDDAKIPKTKHLIIPELFNGLAVKKIRQFAFQNNDVIETVEIANSVEEIEMYAFGSCNILRSVTFTATAEGPKLHTIGRDAFSHCKKLATVDLPLTVKFIDTNAFYNCEALKSISLNEEVRIENDAFTQTGIYNDPANWDRANHALYLSKHLIRVYPDFSGVFTIDSGTVTVGAGAFKNCTQLTGVEIPASVTHFDSDAFLGCTSLKTVTYEGDTKQWLSLTFENDYASPLHYATDLSINGAHGAIDFIPSTVKAIPAGTFRETDITEITIPAGVTSIGAHAFENCKQLKTIVIPDTVTYIGEDAFLGCDLLIADSDNHDGNGGFYLGNHLISVKNDELPADGNYEVKSGTVTISPNAFRGCTGLKSVTIPQSVVWIGAHAFTDCSQLISAEFLGEPSSFFAYNVGGAGRWLDTSEINGAVAAYYLKGNYPNEWNRVKSK